MVDDGTLTLGEPCAPQTLTKQSIVNGELTTQEPFTSIRQTFTQTWKIHASNTDSQLNSMTTQELLQYHDDLHIKLPDEMSDDNLKAKLVQCESTRSWAVWHDHSTICGRGYILVTCNIVYNTAVFKKDDEIQQGPDTNILRAVKDWDQHFFSFILPNLNCSITENEYSCFSKKYSNL